jgi:DNA-binding LacI/PurR family transcriptional regulator
VDGTVNVYNLLSFVPYAVKHLERLSKSMTLVRLAKKLNVSIATISRALSRPEIVAPATRARVLAGVKRYGYRPNAIARSLRTQQSQTIGIVVSDIRNFFFGAIVKAVEGVASANGYSVLICNADENAQKEEAALQVLLDRKVSGLIHCSTGANLDLLRLFQRSGVPVVDLDRKSGLASVDTVVLDNEYGAELAIRHLVLLGHRQIAVIAGQQHLSTGRARLSGFKRALRNCHIPIPNGFVQYGDAREFSGYQAIERLLSLRIKPTAIITASIAMTTGVISYTRERGIRIPSDLSLIGFDDAVLAPYVDPPLTVISQPVELMGRCAAELLLERLRGKEGVELKVFKPELIVRRSTATPPN